jgi:hypothetical protein
MERTDKSIFKFYNTKKMSFFVIRGKKYNIKQFDGGNNQGFINFDKNKIGKVRLLSEKRKVNKGLDTEDYSENPYREIEIHKECNKIIKSKITTNLVQFYDYHIYGDKIVLIMEKYDNNLGELLDKLTFNQLQSVFFQIFFTFIILQDKLGFYQGDFNETNILYKRIPKTKKYFHYVYNGKKYRVPNEGYKIAVSDYGNAIIQKFELAKYEKDYYPINLSKRIELYEILLLLLEFIQKVPHDINDENFQNKSNKIEILNNIIFDNVKFQLLNNFYTIYDKCTKVANQNKLLEQVFDDYRVD